MYRLQWYKDKNVTRPKCQGAFFFNFSRRVQFDICAGVVRPTLWLPGAIVLSSAISNVVCQFISQCLGHIYLHCIYI